MSSMGIIERTILCAIGVGLGACANDAAEGEPEAAQVAIAITQAPGGVQCLVVRVRSNTRTEEREIPVVPGSAITASLTGLPSGSVSLHAAAYDENCQALTAAAVPTWLSDPSEQPLMLVAGNATLWDLALRPNGVVNIATDWADDSANTTQPDVVRAITAGAVHSCAVSSNGLVRCWGSDTAGQLGDGANTMQAHPVTVPSVFDATALASGWEHNCAVLSSGLVACWGSNFYGESGSSATEAYGNPPASLHDISGVVALGAGANHSCALLQLGSVRCWGGNGWGQLGMDKSGSSTPVAVSDVSTAIAIATGAF